MGIGYLKILEDICKEGLKLYSTSLDQSYKNKPDKYISEFRGYIMREFKDKTGVLNLNPQLNLMIEKYVNDLNNILNNNNS